MPATLAPNTGAIGDAIVAYLAALTYPNTTKVYKDAQLELIFDVISQVSDGGAVVEVYGNADDSERRGSGGRIWDEQDWYILSMCSLETATLARKIYDVRDALVVPFQTHATLGGGIYNVFHAQFKPKSGRFGQVVRNGQNVKMHIITLTTRQEWVVTTPPGVVS
jgi:hypothetical protein